MTAPKQAADRADEIARAPSSLRDKIAAAIANARGGRRGMPPIVNILGMLPDKLRDEVRDDADAVLAAIRSAGPQWREIATAPKTRGAYLVYCPDRMNTYGVVWRDDDAWGEPGWFHFGPCPTRLAELPSHWMPLPASPAPPEAISGKEG